MKSLLQLSVNPGSILTAYALCACFGHIAVMPPSSTRSLVLTGHQMLLLVLINKIILELFSLRDILCGVHACVSFKALRVRSDAGQ